MRNGAPKSRADCPQCRDGLTDVKDSRPPSDSDAGMYLVRRRRECRSCGHKFITFEVMALDNTSTIEAEKRVVKALDAIGAIASIVNEAEGVVNQMRLRADAFRKPTDGRS